MKRKIAIIGAGIAGSTLAYALKQDGRFDLQVFTAKSADEIRNGHIPSSQVHFNRLLETERRYGIPDYGSANEIQAVQMFVAGQRMFKGHVHGRAISIDQRIYLAALLDGLYSAGIPVTKQRIDEAALAELADEFDLIIDCTGKLGPTAPFPVYKGLRNAPEAPLRVCAAGIFYGLDPDGINQMNYNIIPGLGELFETSTMTANGVARMVLHEAVPGSEMDGFRGVKGPEAFASAMREVLEKFFPHIAERIVKDEFRLVDEKAYVRIAFKPQVHVPYTTINDTLVLACGDSAVLNDPVTGQGANCASYCADMLYRVIAEQADHLWDISVGELYWNRVQEYVVKMSEWTNAMTGAPSESFMAMMGNATQDQQTADELVSLFTNPIQAHEVFFASERKEAAPL